MSLRIKGNVYSTDDGATWQPMERGTPLQLPGDDLMISRSEVTAAMDELRNSLHEIVATPQNFSIPALQSAIDHEVATTIAELDLGAKESE